ncbi:DNA-3-methyladenine glycosylase family protein [Halovenus halobia]|uniref:DNA-3-methyladenine glycosylase family protein n=1 Tax=Halovenus halobia TaxID=3396622 RepID=UPI003F5558F3
MGHGRIDLDGTAFDLQSTLESGQTYLWWRDDGEDYDSTYGGDDWYLTTTRATDDPGVIKVRQRDGELEYRANVDAEPVLRRRLGLDDDLPAIHASVPDDEVIDDAYDEYWGMRIVREPAFGCVISFICSAQMRVSRIHGMQQSLREAFGTAIEFEGNTYHAYPTPKQLAAATEQQLRDLSLGYRAPYVQRTAEMVADGDDPTEATGLSYEEARELLTRYVGVGDKVADCVLLFSLGYLEAVPLDTWIRTAIEEYFPDCAQGNYTDTSRAIREQLGGEYAGYTQTYLFHYLRNDGPES